MPRSSKETAEHLLADGAGDAGQYLVEQALLGRAELDTDEEPTPPDVHDERMAIKSLPQAREELAAALGGVVMRSSSSMMASVSCAMAQLSALPSKVER